MTTPTVLVATWREGLFVRTGDTLAREMVDQQVKSPATDGDGGALVILGGRSLCRRTAGGEWRTLATSESELSCCLAVDGAIYAGTDDAHVLRLEANGRFAQLAGFDAVPGRDKWYAGTALVDGRLLGPPLGVRSIAATCDGAVLLANVHVGGIPRSTDGGVSWQPTIDIENDVHQVCAHPTRPNIVIAAAATGLCISHDGGATWTIEQEGLHASYCSAVAFAGDDILVAASTDHFARQGAVYRRPIDGNRGLMPVEGGLPRWIEGIADTGCISAHGSAVAIADGAGNLYVSEDAGRSWTRAVEQLPGASGILTF